jgi:hypothetical protein
MDVLGRTLGPDLLGLAKQHLSLIVHSPIGFRLAIGLGLGVLLSIITRIRNLITTCVIMSRPKLTWCFW